MAHYALTGAVEAVTAYLKTKAASGMKVYKLPTTKPMEYPCVGVMLSSLQNFARVWAGNGKCRIKVVVYSPSVKEVNEQAVEIRDIDEIHADCLASVIDALTVKPTDPLPDGYPAGTQYPQGLAAWLTVAAPSGTVILSAVPEEDLAVMDVNEQRHCITTTISISLIVQKATV